MATCAEIPAAKLADNSAEDSFSFLLVLRGGGIHADDHRPDGLHALGTPLLQTLNLDALIERCMTFTHCSTTGSMIGAVCRPSRTMMLTGRSRQRIPGAPDATTNAKDPATFLPRVIAAADY
ncbi:hypothetical protein BH11PLA2_BH11PLA2_26860 [soil metagenome]